MVRDREAQPLAGRYNICYVNGFQTQPGERALWRSHPGLVLRDRRPPGRRRGVGRVAARRTHRGEAAAARPASSAGGPAAAPGDGYDAVEYDNLDSFTRSHGLIDAPPGDRLRHGCWSRDAHRAGLAAGQKNLAGFDGTTIGFDFAVAEECGRYDECGALRATSFGDHVLAIEYRRADFRRTCAAVRRPASPSCCATVT